MGERETLTASLRQNKLAIALAVRDAMREYRKDKPIAFQSRTRP